MVFRPALHNFSGALALQVFDLGTRSTVLDLVLDHNLHLGLSGQVKTGHMWSRQNRP